jgi:hypothetical protein
MKFERGMKVVCMVDNWDECHIFNSFFPKGFPKMGEVYVIDHITEYSPGNIGLHFVGGLTAYSIQFRVMTGFSTKSFKLLSEIQTENKKKEMEYPNPS